MSKMLNEDNGTDNFQVVHGKDTNGPEGKMHAMEDFSRLMNTSERVVAGEKEFSGWMLPQRQVGQSRSQKRKGLKTA